MKLHDLPYFRFWSMNQWILEILLSVWHFRICFAKTKQDPMSMNASLHRWLSQLGYRVWEGVWYQLDFTIKINNSKEIFAFVNFDRSQFLFLKINLRILNTTFFLLNWTIEIHYLCQLGPIFECQFTKYRKIISLCFLGLYRTSCPVRKSGRFWKSGLSGNRTFSLPDRTL